MYDVTFHPIREDEIRDLILKPVTDAAFRASAIAQTTLDPDGREHVARIHAMLDEMFVKAQTKQTWHFFLYGIAAVAGYLHPYWWGKDTALKHLPGFATSFAPLVYGIETVDPEFFGRAREERPPELDDSYSGGGFIPASEVGEFRSRLRMLAAQEQIDLFAWGNLVFALEYAEKNGCGVIEASGVYDTVRGCMTNNDNVYTTINQRAVLAIGISVSADEPDKSAAMTQLIKDGPDAYVEYLKEHLV